jgi:hypothetical protein
MMKTDFFKILKKSLVLWFALMVNILMMTFALF